MRLRGEAAECTCRMPSLENLTPPKFLDRIFVVASVARPLIHPSHSANVNMHLMYTEDPATGQRTYTLRKVLDGTVTKSAHPARFSPDDKYSRQRVTLKKRYGLLLTQQQGAYMFVRV